MDEKTYLVGQDDISETGLSFIEINEILKALDEHEDSPFGLMDRVLEDKSVLQKYRRSAFRGLDIDIGIECYESARHKGVGFKNDHAGYEFGPLQWKIVAGTARTHSPTDSDIILVLPYSHMGQEEDYPTSFAVKQVTLSGPIDRIRAFAAFFRELNEKRGQAKVWSSQSYAAHVSCGCGHISTVFPKALKRAFKAGATVADLSSRFRCTRCDGRFKVDVEPRYSKDTMSRHMTFWVPPRERYIHTSSQGRGDSLYNALGGDGTNSVYLGDGASISASGWISDD